MTAAQPLAESLGLRVEPGLIRHALAEDALDDEIDRPQVWKHMPSDWQINCLGEHFAQLLDGQRVYQPAPLLCGAHPYADVCAATLVAAARTRDDTEWHPPSLAERQRLGKREGRNRCQLQRLGRRCDVHTCAVGMNRYVRHVGGGDEAGREDSVHLAVAR